MDFTSISDYDKFTNEIPIVGDILQPFQFELIFTSAEIQAKNYLAGTSAIVFDWLLYHITW